ncbi:MAG TPA: GGDEF domain-containing protein [Gaiellaceae bacterium]|nr:GGDEF domain-containing protein [Gaiellaceae bacterium]
MAASGTRRGWTSLRAVAVDAALAAPLAALLARSWQVDGPTLALPAALALALAAVRAGRARRRSLDALAAERARALTDHLTGAANRRALDEALARAVARARRGDAGAALVVFDVDHFKRINEEHGWEGGDDVLRGLVERVRGTLRRSDLLARRGGEEFAIVASGVAGEAALRRTAAKVHAIVRAGSFPARGRRAAVTVSVGAVLLDGSLDAAEAESRANRALAAAKRRRDCVVVWEERARRAAA